MRFKDLEFLPQFFGKILMDCGIIFICRNLGSQAFAWFFCIDQSKTKKQKIANEIFSLAFHNFKQ